MADAAAQTKPSLTIKRRIAAPPHRVYAAWTDPEKIMKWFGPDPCEMNVHSLKRCSGLCSNFSMSLRLAEVRQQLIGLERVGLVEELGPPGRMTFG